MKRTAIKIAALALLLAPVTATAQIENPDAAKKFNEGKNLYGQGQYQEALELLEESAELEPNNYSAHYMMGLCLRKLRQHDEAITQLGLAATYNPNYFSAYYVQGLIYQSDKGDPGRAVEMYNRAGEVSEQVGQPYWQAFFNLGVLEFGRQNWDTALNAFAKTVQYNPANERAFASMGRIYMERGEYETALMNFTQASAKKPTWYEPYFHKANVLNRMGNYTEAIGEAEESLKRMPNHGGSLYEKGFALKSLEKWDEAIAVFEQAARDAQWRQMANHQIELIKNRDKYVDIPPDTAKTKIPPM
jgi:tetratricopeptide (TPR) repeat protein